MLEQTNHLKPTSKNLIEITTTNNKNLTQKEELFSTNNNNNQNSITLTHFEEC